MLRSVRTLLCLFVVALTAFPSTSRSETDNIKQLTQQAFQLGQQARYPEAIEVAKRALALAQKKYGSEHPEVAYSLSTLGTLNQAQGRYAEAESSFKRSMDILGKVFGSDHRDAAGSKLALVYQAQGKHEAAEYLYKRALTVIERELGSDTFEAANVLNGLAVVYRETGRNREAEPLLKRALQIREKTLGPEHALVGNVLSNLAHLYEDLRQYPKAEKTYKRALTIVEKQLGPYHPNVATLVNNLAMLNWSLDNRAQAKALFTRALNIAEKTLGAEHPDVATYLHNLAAQFDEKGPQSAEAEKLYKRSLAIAEKAYGSRHPQVIRSLNMLAGFYFAREDWKQATSYFRRGTKLIASRTHHSAQDFGRRLTGRGKSEAKVANYDFRFFVKAAYRSMASSDGASPSLQDEMFQAAQWAASSRAAAALAKMGVRQATGNTELALLVRERQDLITEWLKRDAARIASVSQAPSNRNKQEEAKNLAQLSTIDSRIEQIDERLAREFPRYADLANPQPLTISEAQQQLKANETLVVFLDTDASDSTPQETFIWFVTKAKNRLVRSKLGTRALRDQVDALRCGLDYEGAWKGTRCFDLLGEVYTDDDHRNGKPLPFKLDRAHAVYHALFAQAEDLIAGKDLLIVPSGALTQLPFQALVTEKPKKLGLDGTTFSDAVWLAQKHATTVLPSVSSLVSLRRDAKPSSAKKPLVGFGNPLLEGPDSRYAELAKQARLLQRCKESSWRKLASFLGLRATIGSMEVKSGRVSPELVRRQTPLPETAGELCDVAKDAGATPDDIFLGAQATEAKVKDLSSQGALASYKVLHFATHGALSGELIGSNEPGLLMTPPSDKGTKIDDGYLSASEIAALKLDADWVILSACNTAGGDAKNAEALSGLAKAFFYAGARSLLVSHWYVDSQATVALMTRAFSALRRNAKITRAEAVRQATLSLISDKNRYWHPSYWAPFIVVGEGSS